MAVIAGTFVPWYLGEAYRDSIVVARILSPVILAIALSNVSGSQFLVATGETKYLTISYCAGAMFNLIGNYILIPIYNERGAAITTLCAEWLVTLIQFGAMRKKLGSLHILNKKWKKMSASVCMLLLVLPMLWLGDSIFVVLAQILCGGILYFLVLLLLREKMLMDSLQKAAAGWRDRRRSG
ncbi:MAG: polysaccharide biosynthesis C-terminal domain-containing protein [Lachnospiraceae bacterium]|nr:polysaccharide biosynthesis C-terminal domain-containing protein [Lachnospiraceae bacterium]